MLSEQLGNETKQVGSFSSNKLTPLGISLGSVIVSETIEDTKLIESPFL